MRTPSMLPWQALQALLAIYQTVRVSNGFMTDIGQNASLENPQQTEENLPDLAITATPQNAGSQGRSFRNCNLEVFLEARIAAGREDAQHTAWMVHGDLLAATPTRADALPKGATKIEVTSSAIVQDRVVGQPFIVVQVKLLIGLAFT